MSHDLLKIEENLTKLDNYDSSQIFQLRARPVLRRDISLEAPRTIRSTFKAQAFIIDL